MTIIFTNHALDMLQERDLDRRLLESAICSPDWTEDGEDGIKYAFKRVGHKVIRVVYRSEDKCQIVITAYYDRRLNP